MKERKNARVARIQKGCEERVTEGKKGMKELYRKARGKTRC